MIPGHFSWKAALLLSAWAASKRKLCSSFFCKPIFQTFRMHVYSLLQSSLNQIVCILLFMDQSSRNKSFLSLFSELPPVCHYLCKSSVPRAEHTLSAHAHHSLPLWMSKLIFLWVHGDDKVHQQLKKILERVCKADLDVGRLLALWPVLVGTDNGSLQEQHPVLWCAIISCYFPGGTDGIMIIFFFNWMMEHERVLTLFIDSVCWVNNSSWLQLILTPE